jgi:hypothetical protein
MTLSFWMLTYGLKVFFFLKPSQSKINADIRKERIRAIRRVLIVAVTFAVCYLVRSICVTLVVMHYLEVIEVYAYFSELAWFLISQWIPFLIPVSTCRCHSYQSFTNPYDVCILAVISGLLDALHMRSHRCGAILCNGTQHTRGCFSEAEPVDDQ